MTHVAHSYAVEHRNRGAAAAPRWRGRHYLLMGELSQPIRVLVVDDHRVVREGLRSYLGLVDDIEMGGEASDGGPRWTGLPGRRPKMSCRMSC